MNRRLVSRGVVGLFAGIAFVGTVSAEEPRPSTVASAVEPIVEIRFFPDLEPGAVEMPSEGRRIALEGTVTWISRIGDRLQYLVVEDESAGIWVNVRLARDRGIWLGDDDSATDLLAGMQVEMDGVQDLEGYAPMILPRSIRILSREIAVPAAMPASMDRLFNGCDACRRVEIAGVLQGYRAGEVHGNPHWILVLETEGRRFLATAPRRAIEPDPSDLVDGTLQLRGVAASRFTTRGEFVAPTIHMSGREDFELVAAPPTAAFEAPIMPLARISRFQREPPTVHRIRTRGVVTYAVPGEVFFLQEGAIGVRVETQSPEPLQPGETVEVAGFIDRRRVSAGVSQAAGVSEAVVKRLGKAPPPAPVPIQPDDIVALNMAAWDNGLMARPGDYDGCLISFQARLVEIRRGVTGGILLLSCGKSTVSAAVPAAVFEKIRRLEAGSELEVTGIVQVDLKPELGSRPIWLLPAVERIDLLLRGAEDVRVLAKPSWWTPRRLGTALAAMAGILIGALAWVWLLRRRVAATAATLAAEMRSRRESAVEFNATIRERNRLAANLHDTLLQTMSAIGMQLQSCELSGRDGGKPAANHLGLARRMVDHAVGELRESVWALRSFPLKGQTFSEAVTSLASHLVQGQDVTIDVRITGPAADVSDFVAGNLLLVVQEAIHNALHHASPASITVAVAFDPRSESIDVVVQDDGRGFLPGTQAGPLQGHFGLQGMRERVERLGGALRIESGPESGTIVHARVRNMPYDKDIEGE